MGGGRARGVGQGQEQGWDGGGDGGRGHQGSARPQPPKRRPGGELNGDGPYEQQEENGCDDGDHLGHDDDPAVVRVEALDAGDRRVERRDVGHPCLEQQ